MTFIIKNNIDIVNTKTLINELKKSSFKNKFITISRYYPSLNKLELELSSDLSAQENSELNDLLGVFVDVELPKYRIHEIVSKKTQTKDVRDINYKTELISGKKLHPIQSFTDDGFMLRTNFYVDFIDKSNKGDLVLVVDETYETMPEDVNEYPSVKRPKERIKTRKWVKNDDVIDEVNVKITTKKYDTFSKRNKEGSRRRNEIVNILSEHSAIGGILSGIFVSEEDAFNKLNEIMSSYSGPISTYIKGGRGSLYDDVLNDSTHTWLDGVVVDSIQTQTMVPYMVGITLRTYIVSKLKGEIK